MFCLLRGAEQIHEMRVLFYERNYENLGIEHIASLLKKKGHNIELIFDPGLSENPYLNLPLLQIKNIKKKMLKKAREFKPDIALFSAATYSYPFVREIALMIRKNLKIPTLVGGVHPTMLPEQVIKDPAFDMLCVGEGEYAAVELIERMERGQDYTNIQNIWVKKKNKIYRNSIRDLVDLNTLPFPEKSIFHQYGVFKDNLYIMAGRGCPYNCTYCFNHSFKKLYQGKGSYVRFRDPELVIQEIETHIKNFKSRQINFLDDTFTLNHVWLKKFLKIYKRKIHLPYRCLVRANTINVEIARLLKISGCTWANIGLESGDQWLSDNILRRNLTNQKIIEASKILQQEGIKIKMYTIFGFPDETPEQMFRTVDMVEITRPDAVVSYNFVPYPKTYLTEYSFKKGLITKEIFKKIDKGDMTQHSESTLNHPFKDLANNIKIVLPLYNKAFFPFKQMLRSMMKNKRYNPLFMKILYLASIPFYSGGELWPKFKEDLNMLMKSKRLYKRYE